MRHSASEKMEVIRLVDQSDLSVRKTLHQLDIPSSTFYNWYNRYLKDGFDGLEDRKPGSKQFWNRIPDNERERVRDIALQHLEKTPREIAWYITDEHGYYISESSVYRILKSFDLIASPNYIVLSASDKFKNPTRQVNELWQTDFTYFKVIGWGWYYLSTVMDDYSRYILSWKLFTTMSAGDVKETLDMALEWTGINKVQVRYHPRLLSDNGPCYVSKELQKYLDKNQIKHTRGKPYHPRTQGKIERYHRTMKNLVKLRNYWYPDELERQIGQFVQWYNNERVHESLNNITPADMYYGRYHEIQTKRDRIKRKTLKERKRLNLKSGRKSYYTV
jgi:transposase InsO family protein